MKYSITTTPTTIVDSASVDRILLFSAGVFSTAVAVYIQPQGTKNVQIILDGVATSKAKLFVPKGVSIEAYTDAGTADLAVSKLQNN
jgi:hypothetical protein